MILLLPRAAMAKPIINNDDQTSGDHLRSCVCFIECAIVSRSAPKRKCYEGISKLRHHTLYIPIPGQANKGMAAGNYFLISWPAAADFWLKFFENKAATLPICSLGCQFDTLVI